MRILLRGGRVVSAGGVRASDVLLDGEIVAAVGENLSGEGARVVDCAGKLLFPGFIDGHTHFDLEVGGTITADDFATGSRAALRGVPPPLSTSPPRTRGRPCARAWTAGGGRRRAAAPATTAST